MMPIYLHRYNSHQVVSDVKILPKSDDIKALFVVFLVLIPWQEAFYYH